MSQFTCAGQHHRLRWAPYCCRGGPLAGDDLGWRLGSELQQLVSPSGGFGGVRRVESFALSAVEAWRSCGHRPQTKPSGISPKFLSPLCAGAFGKLGHGNRLAQSTPKVVVALQGGWQHFRQKVGVIACGLVCHACHPRRFWLCWRIVAEGQSLIFSKMFLASLLVHVHIEEGLHARLQTFWPCQSQKTLRSTSHPSVLGAASFGSTHTEGRGLHLGPGAGKLGHPDQL